MKNLLLLLHLFLYLPVGLVSFSMVRGHSSGKTSAIYTHVSKSAISKIRSPLAHLDLQKRTQNGRYVAGG